MTYRNETKLMYGQLVINGSETISLGRAEPIELSRRWMATVKSRIDIQIESMVFQIAHSKEALAALSKGVSKQYEHEGLNPDSPLYGLEKSVIDSIVQIDDETPSPFPGITMNQLMEAQSSPEYKAYLLYALHPDKRVGVSHEDIKNTRIAWEQAYPVIATYVPKWIDE